MKIRTVGTQESLGGVDIKMFCKAIIKMGGAGTVINREADLMEQRKANQECTGAHTQTHKNTRTGSISSQQDCTK